MFKGFLRWWRIFGTNVSVGGKIIVQVEAIKPKTDYKEIIQVNVPTRYFWNPDGTFDGIEFGPFTADLTPWEEEMMKQCLQAITPSMGVPKEEVEDDDLDEEIILDDEDETPE